MKNRSTERDANMSPLFSLNLGVNHVDMMSHCKYLARALCPVWSASTVKSRLHVRDFSNLELDWLHSGL